MSMLVASDYSCLGWRKHALSFWSNIKTTVNFEQGRTPNLMFSSSHKFDMISNGRKQKDTSKREIKSLTISLDSRQGTLFCKAIQYLYIR